MVKINRDNLLSQYIPDEEIRAYYLALMNSKDIRVVDSGNPVIFVDSLETDVFNAGIKTGAYSDGISLIDYDNNFKDDISSMYAYLRNNNKYNLQDFFSRHKAYTNTLYFLGQIKDMIRDRKKDII